MDVGVTHFIVLIFFSSFLATSVVRVRRRRKRSPEVFEVSLEDLSSIWLKHNEEVGPVIPKNDKLESLYGSPGAVREKETVSGSSDGAPELVALPIPEGERGTEPSGDSEKVETEKGVTAVPLQGVKKDSLAAFMDDIHPYWELFLQQKAADLLNALINELGEYGGCPSVVGDMKDSENVELYSVRDNLARVTLKDHTVAVAKGMMKLIGETYMDHEVLVPKAVVAALAHDIGKIPERYSTGVYNTHEHPLISATRLMELAGEERDKIPWFHDAVKAVKGHHNPTKDQFIALLKEADKKAREMELLKFTDSFTVQLTEQWFVPARFVEEIEPHVNVIKKGRWKAFSFKGAVYCNPDLVYEVARKLCCEAKAIDMAFTYASERENAIRRVVRILKEKGYVLDVLRQNSYAVRVEVKLPSGKKKYFLLPLSGEHFKDMSGIEKRKTGYLEKITGMEYV